MKIALAGEERSAKGETGEDEREWDRCSVIRLPILLCESIGPSNLVLQSKSILRVLEDFDERNADFKSIGS